MDSVERSPEMDWQRVALAVKRRRIQRGFRTQKDALAEPGAPGSTVWSQLERGELTSPRATTLAAVEKILDWPFGALEMIARGGDPPQDTRTDIDERVSRLEAKMTELIDEVQELSQTPPPVANGSHPGDK